MLTELSMTIKKAHQFLIRLKSLYTSEERVGSISPWLWILLFVGLGMEYLFGLPTGKLGIVIFFTYALYVTFTGEWLSMRIRCPRCNRRFFMAGRKSIMALYDSEECQHCGLKISEIEDVAQEKMDFIKRSRTK